MLQAYRFEVALLLERDIGKDQCRYTGILRPAAELLHAVMVYDVGVGHVEHGHADPLPQILGEVEYVVGGHPALQSPLVSAHDHRAFRCGVRERDAELYEVCPVGHHGFHDLPCGLQIGVSAGDEAYERLAVVECPADVTHGDPLLCILRWQRHPCRRVPRPSPL